MLLIYPGPFDAVDVPAANVTATRGVPVDVPTDVAASLLEQGWTKPKNKKDGE